VLFRSDQFPADLYDAVQAMLVVLGNGGFKSGGLNFDAKVRRESTDLEDLFLAHIGGMDTFARGLLVAHELLQHPDFKDSKTQRYASFDTGLGQEFEAGRLDLQALRDIAAENPEPAQRSGKQERFENLVNTLICRSR